VVGTTEVRYTVTDVALQTASCSFFMQVSDVGAPVVSGCPADTMQFTNTNVCTKNYTFTAPTVADNCGATLSLVAGFPSGYPFPQTTTLVSYLAEDLAGLRTYCNFSVEVVDFQAPAIVCPSNLVVNNTERYCGANVTFVEPVGTDNCPGVTTSRGVLSPAPEAFFLLELPLSPTRRWKVISRLGFHVHVHLRSLW